MTAFRADPDVGLPPAPRAVPVLEDIEGPLAQPGPAGSRHFLVEAAPVRITGTERGGVDAIEVEGRRVLADLTAAAGSAANVVATPTTLRRELVGPGGMLQETVLALDAPAAAVVQWRGQGRGDGPLRLSLSFRLTPGGSDTRYRAGEDALVVQPRDDGPPIVAAVSPSPESWDVQPGPDGDLRVEVRVASDTAVTLGVSAGARLAWAVRAMEHLDVHSTRLQRPASQTRATRTETGVAELDEGVAWVARRLSHGTGSADALPLHLLWWGIGALAVGAPEAALRALAILEAGGADEDAAFLAARTALVTGRQDVARRHLAFAPRTPWGATAAGVLADALRYAAGDHEIEALRAAAARPIPERGGAVALPMAGENWLGSLVSRTRRDEGATADLMDAADGIRGSYEAWRLRLRGGVSDGPGGRGTWDAPSAPCPAVAGAVACGLLHGILGWEPDAPVGRLGLAPSLPPHLTAFCVAGVHMGDVRLTLDYRREERGHRFTLTPTAGRVPATLVFEPTVATSAPGEVSLDGEPVELDMQRTRDGGALSVQIPLDRPHVLLIAEAPI